MPNQNFIRVPALECRALVDPATFNEADRTVEVCFGSDNPVRTWTWEGPVWEILSFDPKHVDLTRMQNGAPALDNHNRYGSVTDNVLGVVESCRVDGSKGYAKIRFAKDEKGTATMEKVRDGIIRNVSVGYVVRKYERAKASKPGEMDTLRAIDWEPNEVSFVPVNADRTAQVRGEQKDEGGFTAVEYVTINSQPNATRNMTNEKGNQGDNPVVETPETPTAERAEKPTTQPVVVVEPAAGGDAMRAAQDAIASERNRVREIGEAVRAAGLDADFANKFINDGTPVDKARAAIIDEWAKQRGNNPTNPANASVGRDLETEGRRAAMADSLFFRAEPGLARTDKTITDERRRAAEQFRGMTLLDIARRSLEIQGINTTGMDKMEIAKRAITSSTGDFPVLLEGTNRRVLLAAYESVPDTWRNFCAVGQVGDFREYKRIRMGTFGNLDVVNENAEYKTKAIPDGESEKISAGTKGNIINVSRKMIVNDDLSAFTRLAAMLGRAAARSIESDVYAMFALNSGNGPTMGDGNPLFHASHSNIAGTAAAPSVTSFDAIRVQMAQQKDPSGNDFLGLMPKIWLGPIGLGGSVRVINNSQYDTEVSNKFQVPNKVVGLFREIVDTPRLSGTAWYALADQMDEAVFEVVFLDGVQTPYIEQDMPFNVDGLQWKIRLDYGVGAIGWRGIVKNAGA